MTKRILGIDIDGILADFNTSYRAKLLEVTGKDLCPPDVMSPPAWEWPSLYGYTQDEEDATWAEIKRDKLFWEGLLPMPNAAMFLGLVAALPDAHDVYFLTARPGLTAKLQSERWLEIFGFTGATVVIALPSPQDQEKGVGYSKGIIAAGLRLTHFIDDKAENCQSVKRASPETQVFMLHHNYNQAQQAYLGLQGVVVIDSILEFAEAVSDVGD